MFKDYTNSFLLSALNLPVVTDLESLSHKMSLSTRLLFLLSRKTENYYIRFTIPKKDGSPREILSPSYSLKMVQKWILREILQKIKVSEEATAYKPNMGNGVRLNAERHRYSLYILGLDVKDFFPSIKREKVYFLFNNLGYNSLVSKILSNLCTFDGYLPQGAVTSPYISNLVCYKLDKRLKGLCSKRNVIYTRYADDLVFSCDDKTILNKIKAVIKDILQDEGFYINNVKTRLLSPYSHKVINGITINDSKLKANRNMKKEIRAMIHRALVTKDYSNINEIRGYISYVNSIEDGYKKKVIQYINRLILKDYKYFKDVVEEYNKNKLFKNVNDMTYQGEDQFEVYNKGFDFEDLFIERLSFLNRIGCISQEDKAILERYEKEVAVTSEFEDIFKF